MKGENSERENTISLIGIWQKPQLAKKKKACICSHTCECMHASIYMRLACVCMCVKYKQSKRPSKESGSSSSSNLLSQHHTAATSYTLISFSPSLSVTQLVPFSKIFDWCCCCPSYIYMCIATNPVRQHHICIHTYQSYTSPSSLSLTLSLSFACQERGLNVIPLQYQSNNHRPRNSRSDPKTKTNNTRALIEFSFTFAVLYTLCSLVFTFFSLSLSPTWFGAFFYDTNFTRRYIVDRFTACW